MDAVELHRRACALAGARIHAVGAAQWGLATACEGWDVRAVVNHLVGEDRWTPPLFQGLTVEEVGDRFEGDLLGDDPVAAWDEAVAEAVAAVGADGAMERTVHLSFGDFSGEDYALQLFADHLIHGWDIARASGGDERLDADLVSACLGWFAGMEQNYRDAGAVGDRVDVPAGADAQTRLLAMFGRVA